MAGPMILRKGELQQKCVLKDLKVTVRDDIDTGLSGLARRNGHRRNKG